MSSGGKEKEKAEEEAEEEEEDGTCSICQDLYRDPRTLPCAHTFCRRCLTGHVLASGQRRNHPAHAFACPLCNHPVTPPDPLQHRFFWARQFPTDDKLESVVAKLAEARQATARKEGGGEGGGRGKTHCHKHVHTEAEAWCTDHDVALCRECVTSLHKPCSAATPINKAASQRKQEVNDMRTHLDTLRDSFEKELANLDVLENSMAAGRRRTLEDIDDFYDRMLALLADKKEELRAHAEEEYDKGVEGVGRKRGAWKGMVEEIEETSVVAEMLYMQASPEEVLSQFAALKQQFDNLQHMMPALASPQASRFVLRDPEACLQDLRSLTLEESQLDTRTPVQHIGTTQPAPAAHPPTQRPASTKRQRSPQSTGSYSGAETAASLGSDPISSPQSHGGDTRDRRSHTLHKIKRRRQRVSSSNFAATADSGLQRTGRKRSVVDDDGSGTEARQVLLLSAVVDTDKEGYGLGDICVLHPRDVLLVAYLNSPSLRIFFLPPPGLASGSKVGSGSRAAPSGLSLSLLGSNASGSAASLLPKANAAANVSRSVSATNVSGAAGLKPVVCELTHSPCCLAQLSVDLVAATSSTSPQLSLVRVSGSSARRWKGVEMGKQYRAIARAGTRSLALATYHSGDAENVIDLVQFDDDFRSFCLLRTLSSHPAPPAARALPAPPLFRAPHSLWVLKGGEVVVSDCDTPAVLALDRRGQLAFLFKPDNEELLDSPAGVVGSAAGDLYVADACTQGVFRLSPSGQPMGQVLGPDSGLESPVAVALAANGAMYVADFYGGIRLFML